MDYSTEFLGSFYFSRSLTEEELVLLRGPQTGPTNQCHWEATSTELRWDGNPNFNEYIDWLEYLIEQFFSPRGIALNGAVQWEGDDVSDIGVISIRHNRIDIHYESPAEEEDI